MASHYWRKTVKRATIALMVVGMVLIAAGTALAGAPALESDIEATVSGIETASMTGTKWHDRDADGIKDAGEQGLPGWTIYIDYLDDGFTMDDPFAVTQADGSFSIGGIVPGTWKVKEVAQAGWFCSYPASGYHQADFAAGGTYTGRDFGNYQNATKSGMMFEDMNANYDKDAEEPGLPGWTINLVGTDGKGNAVSLSTTTDANGDYSFSVPPGTYTVSQVPQPHWEQSYPGPDGDWDIVLTSGEVDSGNDFGNYQRATVSGVKFDDLNANGVRDAGEPGLQYWTIEAWADAGSWKTMDTMTDASGAYSLSLIPGAYTIKEVLKRDWVQSYPGPNGEHEVTLTSGQIASGKDFGDYQRATVSGVKFNDLNANGVRDAGEPGLQYWTIEAWAGAGSWMAMSTMTDASGAYSLSLIPGTYAIREVPKNGWIQSCPAAPGEYGVTLTSGQVESGNDFGNHQSYEELSVVKTANTSYTLTHEWDIDKWVTTENGFTEMWEGEEHPKISLYFDGSGDEHATWWFDVDYTGTESDFELSGTVTIANTGALPAEIQGVADVFGTTVISVDFGVTFPYTLPVGETLTGTYSQALPAKIDGTNTVTVATLRSSYYATADAVWGMPTTTVGYEEVTVSDPSLGISKRLNRVSWIDSTSHGYEYEDYDSDSDPWHNVILNTVTILETGQSDTATLLVNLVPPAKLGDRVWWDYDHDGVQDDGDLEPGIEGVTVELWECEGTTALDSTLTEADGEYLFDDLMPGDYYVKFILPEGHVFTQQDAGSDDALDSDANSTTGATVCATLDPGDNDMSWDAGIYLQWRTGDSATGSGTRITTKKNTTSNTWFMYSTVNLASAEVGAIQTFDIQAGNPLDGANIIGTLIVTKTTPTTYTVTYELLTTVERNGSLWTIVDCNDNHLSVSSNANFKAVPGRDDNQDFGVAFTQDGTFCVFAHFVVCYE